MKKLRPYQEKAIDWTISSFDRGKNPLLVLPTGTGKTVVFSHLAQHYSSMGQNVLMVVRGKRLVEQGFQQISEACGINNVRMEMAENRGNLRAHGGTVVVASQDTLKGKRLKKWAPDSFQKIIYDEAHHSVAKCATNIFDYFSSALHFGTTATANRADGIPLGKHYNDLFCPMSLLEAIDQGWLVPLHQHPVEIAGLDLSKLRDCKGDWTDDEVNAVVDEDGVVLQMVKKTLEYAGDRPVLFFAASVANAKHISQVANNIKPECCQYIASYRLNDDGSEQNTWFADEDDGRPVDANKQFVRHQVEQFKNGRLQCLASMGMLLEGFDAPNAAVMGMCRPTKSALLYAQAVGRITRTLNGTIDGIDDPVERKAAIAKSIKPNGIVMDFKGNVGKHDIIQVPDILYEDSNDKFVEMVRWELSENGGDVQSAGEKVRKRLMDLADKARAKAEEKAREVEAYFQNDERYEEARRAVAQNAEVVARVGHVPLGSKDRPSYYTKSTASKGEPATPKQVNLLVRMGVSREQANKYHKKQASAIIAKMMLERGWR